MRKCLNPLERNELEKAMLGRGVDYETIQLILRDFGIRIEHLYSIGKGKDMEDSEILVDKIATFFEREENWRALKQCWLENDRSDDLRKLLLKAIKE